MCPISFRIARRTLIRFVCVSAGRIAVGATLTTAQPHLALQKVVDTLAQQLAPIVLAAGQADGNGGTAATGDKQAPMPALVNLHPDAANSRVKPAVR